MLRRTMHLDDLLLEGLTELKRNLRDEVRQGNLSRPEATDVLGLVPELNFPGLMTLLAVGASKENHSTGEGPVDVEREDTILNLINKIPSPVPIEPKEARQAANLLRTGQFVGDLADVTATVLHLVPNFPVALAQDFQSLPRLPRKLTVAITRDLVSAPHLVNVVVRDLLQDGRIDGQPVILRNTVRTIYGQATPLNIAKTVNMLLGNETVRLAIIVYARSQGIQISQEELDVVRAAIDPNDPDLGSLLGPAFSRLVEDFGKPQAMEILERFVL